MESKVLEAFMAVNEVLADLPSNEVKLRVLAATCALHGLHDAAQELISCIANMASEPLPLMADAVDQSKSDG